MYFKKLELYGFKSFVDKTELAFEPGTTAIVGPNGCGKTNVSDSIRWVLGEQSAKSLRGSKMEDVIFNGTDFRKALSMAEVSITLGHTKGLFSASGAPGASNSVSGLLNLETDEITMTRRLYRSGESEYLLNGQSCRLKDIEDLIMDTGVGTNAYSILEQGKMDMILQAKPLDRRYLFEEAAGISKYKSRKEEALRKLEATEQNLLRLTDIIQEIKRQITSLERQAKKAQRYQELSQALRQADLSAISFDLRRLGEGHRDGSARQGAIQQRLSELTTTLGEADASLESLKQSLLEREATLKTRTQALHEIERNIQQTEHHIALYRDRKATLKEFREKSAPELEGTKNRLNQLGTDLQQQNTLHQQLQEEGTRQETHQRELEHTLTSLDILPHETQLAEQRASLVTLLNQIGNQKGQMMELEASKRELLGRLSAVGQEMTRLEQQQRELGELQEIFERFHRETTGDLQGLAARGQGLVHSIQQALAGHWEASASSLQSTRAELQASCEQLEGVIRQHALELQQLDVQQQSFIAVIQQLEQHIRHLTEQRALTTEALMKAGTDLASTRERLHHQKGEQLRLQAAIHESHEELQRREQDLGLRLQREDELETEVSKYEESLNQLLVQQGAQKTQTAESEERVREVRDELTGKESGLKGLRTELASKDQEHHALVVELTKIDMEIKTLHEHLDQTYHFTPEQLSETHAADPSLDREELKTRVTELRQKVEDLGPVNLVAMEEYQELNQRYEFLNKQEQDLRQAKESLTQTIQTINQTTKTMFTEAFEKIRENFREIFRRLFQGGDADLVLLDELQVLESGVEILARPPGKRLQSITLLSGGERALTAIALLFALFKLKPSPFCVLDEIDAPLDDTNIRRFTKILKEYSQDTQFIIITHSKLTMEEADTIYGVTMQEPGASKIISVKFKAASEPTAPPAAEEPAGV